MRGKKVKVKRVINNVKEESDKENLFEGESHRKG